MPQHIEGYSRQDLVREDARQLAASEPLDDIELGTGGFPVALTAEFADVIGGDPSSYMRVPAQQIRLRQGAVIPPTRRCTLSAVKRAAVLETMAQFEQNGRVRRATAADCVRFAAPVNPVRKPDGSWRMTFDYKGINDHLPMPTMPVARLGR